MEKYNFTREVDEGRVHPDILKGKYTRILPFEQETEYTKGWARAFEEKFGMKLVETSVGKWENEFEHGSFETKSGVKYTFVKEVI